MTGLRYTLIGDGPSDRVLDYPIRWALQKLEVAIEKAEWADLSLLRHKPKTLSEKVHAALQLYPADLLFIHRDAERMPRQCRVDEIRAAAAGQVHVAVVPVRMTEAWLLHDELAIRRAAGNPNGSSTLDLPTLKQVEALDDPKQALRRALLTATELTGRRLKARDTVREFSDMRVRTAALIDDFAPLLRITGFAAFFDELKDALKTI